MGCCCCCCTWEEYYELEGTIHDHEHFDPDSDCKILNDAMRGLGTNEDKIIDIVAHRSNRQRQILKEQYTNIYNKDLIAELKSELGGDFEDAVVALFVDGDEYEANCIHKAMGGAGTDEQALAEILCSRTNEELRFIVSTYNKVYNKDFYKDLKSETSGSLRVLLATVARAGRPFGGGFWNHFSAKSDAEDLYEAGEKKLGTDESKFINVLAVRSYDYLARVRSEYEKISKRSFEEAIKSEFSGALGHGFLAIVKCARNRLEYFADCLHDAMSGTGTDDRALIRLIVGRAEIDLVNVKSIFEAKYGKSLEKFVADDTSGDYKRLLLHIIRGN